MGCYGIGVGRTAAAAIEQNHDANGIVWPMPIAPFQATVIPVNVQVDEVRQAAEKIYQSLQASGVEALLDDRNDRLGVKLKDAELTGIPCQIILGPKNLEAGTLEFKIRKTGESKEIPFPDGLASLPDLIKSC